MGRRAATATSTKKHSRVPMTPEDREQYLINLSLDAAEKQLREGTASSQVITHFLKLGSSRELLEQEKIKEETKVYGKKSSDSYFHKEAHKGSYDS